MGHYLSQDFKERKFELKLHVVKAKSRRPGENFRRRQEGLRTPLGKEGSRGTKYPEENHLKNKDKTERALSEKGSSQTNSGSS